MLIFLIYESEKLVGEAGLDVPTPDLDSEHAWQQFLNTTAPINGKPETITAIALGVARATLYALYGPHDTICRHLKIIISTEQENADCFTLGVRLPPAFEPAPAAATHTLN